MKKNLRIAILYDWIDKWGGVERILLALHRLYSDAHFFTSYYDSKKASWAKNMKIHTTFMQNLPYWVKQSRILSLPFFPFAFESLNVNSYDVVISVTSSFSKSVITHPKTKHICILLTPSRFLWILPHEYTRFNFQSLLFAPYREYLKNYDQMIAQRPDVIVSISQTVAQRCRLFYHRQSEVIYPPFDMDYWKKIKYEIQESEISPFILPKKYFLIVSRLEKYKKIDMVIRVFNVLKDLTLVIVGVGNEMNYLKKIAYKNCIFLGQVTDQNLAKIYSNAQALIMPQIEDFGYVSIEAQYFGCPVIAYKDGGATETVIENVTGIFFKNQTSESLVGALEEFHTLSYNIREKMKNLIIPHIQKYELKRFNKQIQNIVSQN